MAELSPNTTLSHYRIVSKIGAGGMGDVYLAQDTRLNRQVAIKLLLADFATDEERLRRFEQEARAASALNHPNIITIHEIGQDNDLHFIVTEFIRGQTLRQKIADRSLDVAESLDIACQTAGALHAAHEAGIIHRDIKPENIMVRPDGYVKVLDFGIAKLTQTPPLAVLPEDQTFIQDGHKSADITEKGVLLGTPHYMSPEQARGQKLDARSDLFSLGVVLYEMVAGVSPFKAPTFADAIVLVLQNNPAPLTEITTCVPPELERIVNKALTKDCGKRYQTAAELLADLRGTQEEVGLSAKRPLTGPMNRPATSVTSGESGMSSDVLATMLLCSHQQNNLPAQLTQLIGREAEVAAIEQLLRREEVRLLTLTGPGGTGKTRLSIQAGVTLLDAFADGVFFVSLAAITDAQLVCSAITQTLAIKESATMSLAETLKVYLRARQMLLVLDNFEQSLTAAPFVADLLETCPRLKVIVTSRAILQIRGEREFAVEPLALPALDHSLSAAALSDCAAVALFVDRARLAKSDFCLTEVNAPYLAEICVRLDGLPLAIELAAARVKLLSPERLLTRLESRLDLLVSGARDMPARQQTIRNTIKWSYDLIDSEEKSLFRWLSVFAGGFSIEAAESLCNAIGQLEMDVLDGISSLVTKSLLKQQTDSDGTLRFTMLGTIREYGLEQLEAMGEARSTSQHHAEYFLQLAEKAEANLLGRGQQEWLDRLDVEHDNLRAALNSAEESGESGTGLKLAGALWRFWLMRSHWTEGRERLTRALQADKTNAELEARAKALNGLATLGQNQSDYEFARVLFEEGLEICRARKNQSGIATALTNLGWIAFQQCNYETARALSEEGLALHKELGNQQGTILAINNLGCIAFYQGDYELSISLHKQNARFRKEAGDPRGLAFSMGLLTRALLKAGDYQEAAECVEELVTLIEAVSDKQVIALTHLVRGELLSEQGDNHGALPLVEKAIRILREIGDRFGLSFILIILANIVFENGDSERAEKLYKESLSLQKEARNKHEIADCFEQLAKLAVQEKRFKQGANLLGAAMVLREEIASRLSPKELIQQQSNVDAMRATLGEVEFQAAWTAGRALSIEQAVACAMSGVESEKRPGNQ